MDASKNISLIKTIILVFSILFFSISVVHDYYVSVTIIEYHPKSQNLNINTKYFANDLDSAIRTKYNKSLVFDTAIDTKLSNDLIKSYVQENISVKINKKQTNYEFDRIEQDNDIIKCFFKISGVKSISTIEIYNSSLIELISEQQNIVRMNINSITNNFILTSNATNRVINYN